MDIQDNVLKQEYLKQMLEKAGFKFDFKLEIADIEHLDVQRPSFMKFLEQIKFSLIVQRGMEADNNKQEQLLGGINVLNLILLELSKIELTRKKYQLDMEKKKK